MDFDYLKGRKVILYGIGKYQEDFEYIFDELNIVGYLSEVIQERELHGKSVYDVATFKTLPLKDADIIICSEDKEIKDRLCDLLGGEFEGTILYADELFEALDEEQNIDYWAGERKVAAIYNVVADVHLGGGRSM